MRRLLWLVAALALAGGLLSACGGGDDGSGVRTVGCDSSGSGSGSGSAADSGSGSASGSGSGSGSSADCGSASGSGSGLSGSDIGDQADSVVLQAAVDGYREYVEEQVADTVTKTKAFDDAVRAGDIETAKSAFGPSRFGWESIEPIAGLVEEIDGKVDARVDDFESETDPEWTGWHRIEYLLFDQGTTEGATAFADQLDEDLATLQAAVPDLEITPLAMARGASELIEEVSQGKITGEEDRYSHTDLYDIRANVDGSKKVIELLTPALTEADPGLLDELNEAFAEVDTIVDSHATPDGGFEPFDADTMATPEFKAALAKLSEELAEVPGALGLK